MEEEKIVEGDTVEAVTSVNVGDKFASKQITKGKQYPVVAVGELTGNVIIIDDLGKENCFISERFKKINN